MTGNGNNPADHRGMDSNDRPGGEEEVLRSGQKTDDTLPGGSEWHEASAGGTEGEIPCNTGLLDFKTYRYRGWLPSGRIILGKEIITASIVWLAVYVSLSLSFVMAGFFGIPLEFLDPLNDLDEYGLLRLDLIALVVSTCALVCRIRSRLAWRKHLLGGR